MPYVLTRCEIEYYAAQMESKDVNIQRDGLQRLFQEMQSGRRVMPSSRLRIELNLERLIQSPVSKVRKWALHLATALDSKRILAACVNQLYVESDVENINWVLAALSRAYSKTDLLELIRQTKKINPLLESISGLQLNASTALFSRDNVNGLSTIVQELRHSEANTRSWLTKLYGYHNLAQRRGMDGYVTQKDMLDLITDGDVGLQEYGMWGLCLHGAQDTREIPQNLLEDSSYYDDTLKWFFQFAQYVPDLARDQDRIVAWVRCRTSFNRSAREGLINLLLHTVFSRKYVEPLVDWYIDESYASVRRLLIQYMASNVEKDDSETFFAVIEGEFHNADVRTMIECEISLNPSTMLEIVDGNIQPKGGQFAMKRKYDLGREEKETIGVDSKPGQTVQSFGNIDLSGSSITNLQIQQGIVHSGQAIASPMAFDYQAVAAFLEQVKKYELSVEEFGAHATQLQNVLDAVETAVNKREPPSKFKKLLETVKDLAVGVSGSLIASGISAQASELIQRLGL